MKKKCVNSSRKIGVKPIFYSIVPGSVLKLYGKNTR